MSNHIKIPRLSDSLLIGFDRKTPTYSPVWIVDIKRMNKWVDIINAFEGKEALDIYEKLTTVNKKEGTKNG